MIVFDADGTLIGGEATDTTKPGVAEYRRKLQLEEQNLEYYTEQMLQAWRRELSATK